MINCKKIFRNRYCNKIDKSLVEFCFTPWGTTLLIFRVNHAIVFLGVTPKSGKVDTCIICTETALVCKRESD